MWYSIERDNDTFTIIPNYTGFSISLEVSIDNCENNTVLSDESVIAPLTLEYTLPKNIDETYIFKITNGETLEEVLITVPQYKNFLNILIEEFECFLCKDDCTSCDQCNEYTDKELSAFLLRILAFFILNKNKYAAVFDAIINCFECDIKNVTQCILYDNLITGNKENSSLVFKIISLYYLTFYYSELRNSTEELVKEQFNYTTIISCIKSKNIDLDCIKNSIENMGTFTINSAAYVNQPPSQVGDNTLEVNNRATTTLTLAMFTTQTTPTYLDPEGDPVTDVRIDTLPADGQIQLSGTPIVAGDIINVTDINNNLLVFVSPNQDPLDSDTFTFSLRDAGSGQFAS